jgi:hypothetical protein
LKILEEVWAGRACAGVNEKELTTCGKKWGQKEGKEEAAVEKRGPATSSCALAVARGLSDCGLAPSFQIFWYFFILLFWVL